MLIRLFIVQLEMQLQKARQKLVHFQVEIRRSHKDKMIKQFRQELTMPQTEYVNKLFKQFIDNKQSQIPSICLQHYKNIELNLLSQLITAMQNRQVSYTSKNTQKWFIDCTSIINLKFMALQQIIVCPHLLTEFFRETVRVNYEKISNVEQTLKNRRQGCLFNLVQNQSSGELELPKIYQKSKENSQSLEYEVVLLNFWSNYLQNTQDNIQKDTFTQMMSIFTTMGEFKDILLKRQASIFIKTILQHIKISNILTHCTKTNSTHHELAKQCYSFIRFIRMKMPFLIKKAVDYRLTYHQIAQILHRMYQLSNNIPDLFQTCVAQCQHLNNFILLLLRDESAPQEATLNRKAALLVINCVAQYGIFDLLYLNQAINITRQLVNVTLFNRATQHLCSLVLYNIIFKDREKYLSKIFQLVDYDYLLSNLEQGSQSEVYQLLVLVLQNYYKSEHICTKILNQSEFVTLLHKYGATRDIDKLVQQLTRVIRTHLQYFLQKYPKTVTQLYQLIKQHQIKDRDECMKQLQAHFQLACKEAEL